MRIVLVSIYADRRCLGMRYLSSNLKKAGFSPELVIIPTPNYGINTKDEVDTLVKFSAGADIIGISLMSPNLSAAIEITRSLKQNSNAKIIWGGVHPTIRPEECLRYADMVCIGEGEQSFLSLVRNLQSGESIDGIDSIWIKDKGTIIKNNIAKLATDLDSLPFPDYDYSTHYQYIGGRIIPINESGMREINITEVYELFTSRGCPYSCTYCTNNYIHKLYKGQRYVRHRSPENVIEEMRVAKEMFPYIQHFSINDDLFFARPLDDIVRFSKRYKEIIGLPFTIWGGHPKHMTEDSVEALLGAGLNCIRMGIETASEPTKAMYGRNVSNDCIMEASRILSSIAPRLDEPPIYDIIIGNPWESHEALCDTLFFVANLPKPFTLQLFYLTFYRGTELGELADEKGVPSRPEHRNIDHSMRALFSLVSKYASMGQDIPCETLKWLADKDARNVGIIANVYMENQLEAGMSIPRPCSNSKSANAKCRHPVIRQLRHLARSVMRSSDR